MKSDHNLTFLFAFFQGERVVVSSSTGELTDAC